MCVYIYILHIDHKHITYIYIYIYREREREREHNYFVVNFPVKVQKQLYWEVFMKVTSDRWPHCKRIQDYRKGMSFTLQSQLKGTFPSFSRVKMFYYEIMALKGSISGCSKGWGGCGAYKCYRQLLFSMSIYASFWREDHDSKMISSILKCVSSQFKSISRTQMTAEVAASSLFQSKTG